MKKIAIISNKKPLADRILHTINDAITQIIEQAGYLPIGIPFASDSSIEPYAEVADAYIFLGQDDLNPFFYGQEPGPGMTALDLERDNFNLALFKQLEGKKPVLGINYGMQLINVARGGTLKPVCSHIIHQSDQLAYHSLNLREDSFLYPWYGRRMIVNSHHRYQIDQVGAGLTVAGCCHDDIEALQDITNRVYAIQWNPEQDDRQEMHRLFHGFLQMV